MKNKRDIGERAKKSNYGVSRMAASSRAEFMHNYKTK